MDLFVEKLEHFLTKKTEIVDEHKRSHEEERKQAREAGEALGEPGLTYDMNKFLKTVREFEAERAKKSKKRIKDLNNL